MAVFAFYSFEIKHLARQVELDFPDLEEKPKHEEQEELFHDVFAGDSVDLWTAFRRANGSYDKRSMERYKNEILAHRDGVIAMTIEANKHKTTIEDKHKVTHPHNPFCFVIIDYRKGQNLIALQKNGAFTKPEKLAEIILSTFNRLFEAHDLRMVMKPLVREGLKFWDAVTEIRTRHHDKVRRISLDFSNAQDTADYSSNQAIALISAISKKLDANGMMVVEAKDDMEVDLDMVYEDMLMLADICQKQPEYELNVHFFSYGVYRFGSDVTAQFGVDERVIDNFQHNIEEPNLFGENYTLDRWLENMKDLFDANEYVKSTSVEPTTKQSRRR